MTKIGSWLSLSLIGMACLLPSAGPAHALNLRSFVSGAGNDGNACTRAAPCLIFAAALTQTNAGGVINCLDPGGFGTLVIDKAITIDCTGTFAGVLVTSGSGIFVNAGASDVVILRGLSIEGVGPPAAGINVLQVGALRIEQCKIFGFSFAGILMPVPTGVGSELYVSDSVISEISDPRGFLSAGINITVAGTATVRASLSNVKLDNNRNGLFVQSELVLLSHKVAEDSGLESGSCRDSTWQGG
jgi:nitrous oxidase accessory protein NosD